MSLLQRKVLPRPGKPTRMMISFCRSGRRLLRRPADPNAPLDLCVSGMILFDGHGEPEMPCQDRPLQPQPSCAFSLGRNATPSDATVTVRAARV